MRHEEGSTHGARSMKNKKTSEEQTELAEEHLRTAETDEKQEGREEQGKRAAGRPRETSQE